MGRESDAMDEGEFQIAVAAAAFAVKSIEESRASDERRTLPIPYAAFPNAEDTAPAPGRRTRSIKFSDDVVKPNLDVPDSKVQKTAETRGKLPEKTVVPAPAIKKRLSFTDTQSNRTANSQPQIAPSIKRTSTFDKSLDRIRGRKFEIEEPNLEVPAPIRPPFLPAEFTKQTPKPPGTGDIDADAWEKAEMAKIKEKHEKVKTTILDWEQKKKTKAKRRLQRIEAELDKRRAKALQDYGSDLARIEGVAGGARSQADENRRNAEFKEKEKANKIRLTGKLPAACWCC